MIEVRVILCDELSGRQVSMIRVSELRPRLSLCPSKTEMVRWLSGYLVSTRSRLQIWGQACPGLVTILDVFVVGHVGVYKLDGQVQVVPVVVPARVHRAVPILSLPTQVVPLNVFQFRTSPFTTAHLPGVPGVPGVVLLFHLILSFPMEGGGS